MNKNNQYNSDLLKIIFVPIHKEGIRFVLLFFLGAVILAMINSTLGLIGLILACWCLFFFRDPERFTPLGDNLVISPADGVVNSIERLAIPPAELSLPMTTEWIKISIFLNVFNVHVNRVPVAGKITRLIYQPGEFLSANLEDASLKNERQTALLATKSGKEVIFVQIAGLIARRIVCDLKEGQEVSSGERYGIIRFGSRMDVYLPQSAQIKVMLGQTMVGGETVIAELAL